MEFIFGLAGLVLGGAIGAGCTVLVLRRADWGDVSISRSPGKALHYWGVPSNGAVYGETRTEEGMGEGMSSGVSVEEADGARDDAPIVSTVMAEVIARERAKRYGV